MSHFPSLPNLELIGLFKNFHGRGIRPLLEYHDAILRSDSELSVGDRELIAAYVSSINGCHYCFSAHRDHAKAWGIDADVFGDLLVNTDHASLSEKQRVALEFARKLTVDPKSLDEAAAGSVYAAGYSEAGFFDIISVTALYNFMNRILEGAGIKAHVRVLNMSDEARRRYRYTDLWSIIAPSQT
jgi:uncharacterized peroxidase-related enzyme